jgi:hypothetical protein
VIEFIKYFVYIMFDRSAVSIVFFHIVFRVIYKSIQCLGRGGEGTIKKDFFFVNSTIWEGGMT